MFNSELKRRRAKELNKGVEDKKYRENSEREELKVSAVSNEFFEKLQEIFVF